VRYKIKLEVNIGKVILYGSGSKSKEESFHSNNTRSASTDLKINTKNSVSEKYRYDLKLAIEQELNKLISGENISHYVPQRRQQFGLRNIQTVELRNNTDPRVFNASEATTLGIQIARSIYRGLGNRH
jgi:hypothetical protein